MSKALCIVALSISALLMVVFLLDLIIGIPFGRFNLLMDISFIVCSGAFGALSFLSLRQIK